MGIPSYYRTLITKIPHAIQRVAPSGVSALVIDMNCMIYHVLKEPKMLAIQYPGSSDIAASKVWERKLQEEVCAYLTHIWRSAGAPLKVYVALDGVVPYAKIKQQRFRRFKSASATATTNATEVWDTNAITPGTEFMASMGSALRVSGSKYGWIISDTEEAGEGEHKVLRWLLSTKLPEGSIVVYGLDADLILLCLLAGDKLGEQYPLFLLREAMAFGKMVRLNENSQVDLCFFKVACLYESLQRGKPWSREQFYDYIFGMSFCGNDFLPTGLSLRIRDEGHSILLAGLNDLWSKKMNLVKFDEAGVAKPNADGLKAFAKWISLQEERLIVQTIKRKMSARMGDSADDNLPIIEQAEQPMVDIAGDKVYLKKGWKSVYNRLALGEDSVEQRRTRVADFWQGWCWILDYYQGQPVDLEWVYPAGYPPTWSDLVQHFSLPLSEQNQPEKVPLKPQEQLALVLPMRSWNLLLKTPYRNLPAMIPQYWPQGFHLETFGKRFGWECEPMIPMLTPARLRYEVSKSCAPLSR
jgi:5'-3' exoribonuclease 2